MGQTLLGQQLWAGPTHREHQQAGSVRSRPILSWIGFSDQEPDFVPPPPREDDEAERETAESLFEGLDPEEPDRRRADVADDNPQGPGHPIVAPEEGILPPQRDYFDPGFNSDPSAQYTWQVMPSGLLYRSYLAGEKESRIASVWSKDSTGRTVWENTLGGRIGLLRHGTVGAYRPKGWQFDFEGAALPRVLPGTVSTMLEAVDFRVGLISTWAVDRWHIKAGYYHLSSHLGDEFVIANPMFTRLNYVRDSAITGATYDLSDDWQTYGEVAYAFGAEDGAKPLELQYGLQYTPMVFGLRGAPFAAINGHTRQDFGGITSVNMQAGWQWRGTQSQHLMRLGMQYYKGPALQYSFPGGHDRLIGGGLWFDF